MQNNQKQPKQTLQVPKSIIVAGKTIQFFSKSLATKFAQNLFITPIKFTPPKREKEMLEKSSISRIIVPAIKKDIIVYQYGTNKNATKTALLIHGWNGRGTQLITIATMLMRQGYNIVSFDAPGHGKAPKTKTNLHEFIQSTFEVEKQFGPFDLVVGHSLGGLTTLNALRDGLKTKKAVLISSGDIIEDVITEFINQIQLQPSIGDGIKQRFEKQFNKKMEAYDGSKAAETIDTSLLIIHDDEDVDVDVKAAYNIKKHSKNAQIMITNGLGHKKILGDKKVIEKIKCFIEEE